MSGSSKRRQGQFLTELENLPASLDGSGATGTGRYKRMREDPREPCG